MEDKIIRLLDKGDDFEKVNYPKVESKFFNYEKFWQYAYYYRKEGSIQIREDVPELTIIFRHNYSIFFNLLKSFYFKEKFLYSEIKEEYRFFDDFIIYLSNSLELTEKLILFLFIFEDSFTGNNDREEVINDFTDELSVRIIDKIKEMIESGELQEDIECNTLRFLKECNRTSIPLGNLEGINQIQSITSDYFKSKDNKLKKEFYTLKTEITTYRNLIMHEVKKYLFRYSEKYYIPAHNKLRKYDSTQISITKKRIENDFQPINVWMNSRYSKAVFILNKIWKVFLIDLFTKNKAIMRFYESVVRTEEKKIDRDMSTVGQVIGASDVSEVIEVIEGRSDSFSGVKDSINHDEEDF